MDRKSDYELESYEKYFGDVERVKRINEECPLCHKKFFFTHSMDHENFFMRETAICSHCDFGRRKIISCVN